MTVSQVDSYYKAARRARIHPATVRRAKLQDLASTSNSFYRRTRDSELWGTYNRLLRRVIWDILNTPLPASHLALGLRTACGDLDRELAGLQEVAFRTASGNAVSIVRMLRSLADDGADPLGSRCRSVLREGGMERAVVLVRSRRLREPVEEHFRATGCPVQVIVPAQLAGLSVHETLVVVGQARFYDASVLNAPRAEKIWVIRYRGLRDIETARGLLVVDQTLQARKAPSRRTRKRPPSDDFFTPTIDWDALRARAAAHREGSGPTDWQLPNNIDNHLARLHILAGGYAVYLESERSSKVLGLYPEADAEHRVRWVTSRELQPGSIVLLRREGGSRAFIEEIADQIMGSEAGLLRYAQQKWKKALRTRVYDMGVATVQTQLRQRGARYQNVAYWMSPRSIRTRDRRDFRILMAYLEMHPEADILWEQMGAIDSAHRKAGHVARRRLLEKVHGADLSPLDRVGYLDFQVEGHGAGTLTAFWIEGKAPRPDRVAESLLHHPFEIGPDLWLE